MCDGIAMCNNVLNILANLNTLETEASSAIAKLRAREDVLDSEVDNALTNLSAIRYVNTVIRGTVFHPDTIACGNIVSEYVARLERGK